MITTGKTTILLLTRAQRARLWLGRVDWGEAITLAMLAALLLWGGVRAALPGIGAWLAPQPQLIYIVPTAALPTAPLATLAPVVIERQVLVVVTPTAAPELPAAPVVDAAPVAVEQAAPPPPVPTSAPAGVGSAPAEQAAPAVESAPSAAPLVGWGGGAPPPTELGLIDQAADAARTAQRTIGQAVLGPAAPTMPPNGWGGGGGKGW